MTASGRTGPNPVLLAAGVLALVAAMAGRMGWFDGVPWDSVAIGTVAVLYLLLLLAACATPFLLVTLLAWLAARGAWRFWRRRTRRKEAAR